MKAAWSMKNGLLCGVTMMKKKKGKPSGMTYADMLAQKRMMREAVQQAASDATVQVRADVATQRALWLAVCSIADAYGFGPERMKQFFVALQENTDDLEAKRREVDDDFAYEKLRLRAEKVTGMQIKYLFEKDAVAAAK